MYTYLQKFIVIIRHISRCICSINRTFVASIKKFQIHRLDAQRTELSARSCEDTATHKQTIQIKTALKMINISKDNY